MKLTIIVEDNTVYVDGLMKAYAPSPLELSNCGIPNNIWALQWKESAGWIEFKNNDDGTKPANEPITELPNWANACVEVWNAWTPDVVISLSENEQLEIANNDLTNDEEVTLAQDEIVIDEGTTLQENLDTQIENETNSPAVTPPLP